MLRKIRKIHPFVFGSILLMSFYGMIAVRYYCTGNMPDYSRPEQGRIVPIEANHQKMIYVSPAEEKSIITIQIVLGLMAVSAGALLFYRLMPDHRD